MIFATIRPNNIEPLAKDESRSGDVSTLSVDIKDLRTIIKDVVRKASEGVDLSEAKVIIAGGRGVKSEDGFETIKGTGTGSWRSGRKLPGEHVMQNYCDYSCHKSSKRVKS